MVLLSELIDQEIRDVVLRVHIADITEKFVDDIVSVLEEHKGKHSLIFNIVDNLNKYEVDLLSRKIKINLDKDFFDQITSLNQLKLSIK